MPERNCNSTWRVGSSGIRAAAKITKRAAELYCTKKRAHI